MKIYFRQVQLTTIFNQEDNIISITSSDAAMLSYWYASLLIAQLLCYRRCKLSNDFKTFQAAVCIGRQPSPHSDMWALGQDFQLNQYGEEMYASEVVQVKNVLNRFVGKRRETSAPKVSSLCPQVV